MPLILAVRKLCGKLTLQDMQMITDINRIIMNNRWMHDLLKKTQTVSSNET